MSEPLGVLMTLAESKKYVAYHTLLTGDVAGALLETNHLSQVGFIEKHFRSLGWTPCRLVRPNDKVVEKMTALLSDWTPRGAFCWYFSRPKFFYAPYSGATVIFENEHDAIEFRLRYD